MSADGGTTGFDPDAVTARYLAERDKRLVAGRADIRDLATDEHFGRYLDDPFTPRADRAPIDEESEVIIAGGGIAGVVVGAKLRERGVERIRVVDNAGGFGGTWYWNRYPGVMCDVESYVYLPMLEELDYIPTTRYAFGEEIRGHLEAIAERYGLVDDALFHTKVTRAEWDEAAGRWRVHTDRGDTLTSRWYILATGILNRPKLPATDGMEVFAGHSFHAARWDYGYTGGAPGNVPMTNLSDKVVGLVGTGATGIQVLPPLAQAAKQVYVFQRTPSAVGVRGNRPTDPLFADTCTPGWQQARMDNLQSVMLGRPVEEDLTDDGWTHHYAKVHNPPRWKGMTTEEYVHTSESLDFGIMEEHRNRVAEVVRDPATAEILKPQYRYLCKRPCFHDEYLEAYNEPNVTLVDCPAGFDRITAAGPVVGGQQYEVDCLIYGTGFEAEATPLPRRIGQDLVGRGGRSLADKWADEGAATLFGMMSRGFPNAFVMPAPAQQGVVTVNYTHLAVLGADFVAQAIAQLDAKGVDVFDVGAEAEDAWVEKIVAGYVDGSHVMSACTPSRINNEGNPKGMDPRNGNYGRGFGDYFAYRDLLHGWLEAGDFEGLELESRPDGP
jgi:cation diffusion facilitator CzcD-associated flavoprotein CzcO